MPRELQEITRVGRVGEDPREDGRVGVGASWNSSFAVFLPRVSGVLGAWLNLRPVISMLIRSL